MALFSTLCFAKYLRVGEDGPGRGHLCHTDTFLVYLCAVAYREQRETVEEEGIIKFRLYFLLHII